MILLMEWFMFPVPEEKVEVIESTQEDGEMTQLREDLEKEELKIKEINKILTKLKDQIAEKEGNKNGPSD